MGGNVDDFPGFEVVGTGGGCKALEMVHANDNYTWVTDCSGSGVPTGKEDMVGTYDRDGELLRCDTTDDAHVLAAMHMQLFGGSYKSACLNYLKEESDLVKLPQDIEFDAREMIHEHADKSYIPVRAFVWACISRAEKMFN